MATKPTPNLSKWVMILFSIVDVAAISVGIPGYGYSGSPTSWDSNWYRLDGYED